jgi:hypothetical protein
MITGDLQLGGEPIQSKSALDSFVDAQSQKQIWQRAAILADKDKVLVCLLDINSAVIQALRICFDEKSDLLDALRSLNRMQSKIECSYLEDGIGPLHDAHDVQSALNRASPRKQTLNQAYGYFDFKKGIGGRGPDISAPTARDVVFESHGYCMFEGCGLDLGIDHLTGVKGNFRYLAHIVASSEDGPRGNEHSHALSDDPNNVMVLCDKHHRLIDKIAADEYPAKRLKQMKQSFREACGSLLHALKYQEVPTYTAFWPIGGSVPDDPSPMEYAVSLHPFGCRPSSTRSRLIDRHTEGVPDDSWWRHQAPRELNDVWARFSMISEADRQKAGIYALGPSTMMVGLGAVLGNKNSLCVVPKCRTNGWGWARKEPLDPSFTIDTSSIEGTTVEEVAVTLFLTDTPAESEALLEHFTESGIPVVEVHATAPGSGSLSHYRECALYREALVQLFHNLRNTHSVKRIHLVHCASNVACVEAGRAIEHNHPCIRVYEHCKNGDVKYFVPRLDLITGGNKVKVEPTPKEVVDQFHQTFNSP